MHFRKLAPDASRIECSSAKIGYATEREARQAAADSGRLRGVPLDVYQCRECLKWHLTSRTE